LHFHVRWLRHELSGSGIRGLVSDRRGGLLAIVNGTALRRRAVDGAWQTLAQSSVALACCLALPDAILVGTDDARALRLAEDGELEPIPAFDRIAGRDTWYAGAALVNGQLPGPPLGVRSMWVAPRGTSTVGSRRQVPGQSRLAGVDRRTAGE
jgi:hypothetical protein